MALLVTIDEAKAQLQLSGALETEQLAEINRFIVDAAGWVENYTGHILEGRDVTEEFTGFGVVQLRAWPIAANAAAGVAYIDGSGTPIAPTGARLDVSKRPARVLPPTGRFWPFLRADQQFSVTIRAGYADPADVPRDMRRAMLLLISAYDSDREGGDILAKAEASARRLCGSYRLRRL